MDAMTLKSALFYHNEGLCVIPVEYQGKKPALPTWEEFHTRCSTEKEVYGWFGNGHQYNIGISHGEVSGNYVALDIDHDAGIFDSLKLVHPYLFAGRVEQSGSGEGYHIPLRLNQMPDFGQDQKQGRPRGNRTWKSDLGVVNIRARFCQTVAPPSVHPTGKRYRFVKKGSLTVVESLDPLIGWLDQLSPPPMPQQKRELLPRSATTTDDLLSAVKQAWPDVIQVFAEFNKANKIEEVAGELKLRGNGGLYVTMDRQQWYSFRDEFGGGVFEAWGYCRHGSSYDKHDHFRGVLLEMAEAAGISLAPTAKPIEPPKPQTADYWSNQYQNYWAKMRVPF